MEVSESFTFLRKIPLFADLPDSDLEKICLQMEEIFVPAGKVLFSEGSIGQDAYIIIDGQIEIYKVSNRQTIQLAVRQTGEVIGEMAIIEAAPRSASGRALTDSRLMAIGYESFNQILDNNPSAVRILLHTVTNRLQSTELHLRQSEKMAQLGLLTAGIAHELNNPSAAVQRGTERIKSLLAEVQRLSLAMNALNLPPDQIQNVQALGNEVQRRAQETTDLDPLERSDREGEIENWLAETGLEQGWEYCSALVDLGYDPLLLESLCTQFPGTSLGVVLRWASVNFTIYRLLDEVSQGSGRMSEIVKALKTYVFLDQGPIQEVNIHEGLENTLVMLRFKLKQGINIRREYDPNLPAIEAYGSELNQVWTNIIDNAIDAMDGKGEITLHTSYHESWVLVEITDNGPGIPAEVLPKIFSPFFTTKAVGKGTGLGLNTSYNIIHKHNGEIKVESQPGETHFGIRLPRKHKTFLENPDEAGAALGE
jgi:signal transduction histidine kinase